METQKRNNLTRIWKGLMGRSLKKQAAKTKCLKPGLIRQRENIVRRGGSEREKRRHVGVAAEEAKSGRKEGRSAEKTGGPRHHYKND